MAEAAIALAGLIARLPADTTVRGRRDRCVTAIATDSRAVVPGALFVALRGRHDGHDFLAEAIANGAAAVVVRHGTSVSAERATVVAVADTYRALSALAAGLYGDPSRALRVAGVTGTNGKTTTVQMLRAILDDAGLPCGTIGTVGAEFGAQRWPLAHTTPLPPELQGLLASMRAAGASAVAMEVSSHALALDRVEDVRFRVAVLTNVTRDHLDFHHTMEAYAQAKRRLFSMAPVAVLNLDDPYGARWAAELRAGGVTTIGYGTRGDAALTPRDLVPSPRGSRFTIDGRPFALRLPGRFNVDNALAAIGAARALGVDDECSARALARLERVPGRMERLHDDGVDVVVDYAHTPDALERVLRALREGRPNSVALVFGCGGDRDRGKRPEMGAVAARYADAVYVTNDNPRGEDPGAIADAIVKGMGGKPCIVELDRRRAIERAVAEARPGDVVLVAGKGHETHQILGDRIVEFDDVAVARHALSLREAVR